MSKFRDDPDYAFIKFCVQNEKVLSEEQRYLQIIKMMDLWAFGNTIIELMVGKTSEIVLNTHSHDHSATEGHCSKN